jgi:hypothetical protein
MEILPASRGFANGTFDFYPMDVEELFLKNKKKLGPEWEFFNKPISYTCNKYGFREQEFDGIDWNNSVVCFGCSHTFGIGIPNHETWVRKLENRINTPCVNLSIPGGSFEAILHNIVWLKYHDITPKNLIVQIPDPGRNYFVDTKFDHPAFHHVIPELDGVISQKNMQYYTDVHLAHKVELTMTTINLLYPDMDVVYFFLGCPSVAEKFGLKRPVYFDQIKNLDIHRARDCSHFGSTVMDAIVDFVYQSTGYLAYA